MKIIDLLSGVFYGVDASVDTAVDFIIHVQFGKLVVNAPNELVNCERDS